MELSQARKNELQKNWEASPSEITGNPLADFNIVTVSLTIFVSGPNIKNNDVFYHSPRNTQSVIRPLNTTVNYLRGFCIMTN